MSRLCELTSPLGADLRFARMRVSEGLSRLFEIELIAHSRRSNITASELLGRPLGIRVNFGDGLERFYNGYLTRFAYGASEGRMFSYRLSIRPWLWFLTRQSDCMVFQDMTVPDILDQVFEREATKALDRAATPLSGQYSPWEYCVQYRETDFNFVSRLMEQEGIYYYFEHSGADHRLVLADSKGAHPSIIGNPSVDYVPGGLDDSRPPDCIATWDVVEGIEAGQYVLNDFNPIRPNQKLLSVRRPEIAPTHARGASEIYDYPGEYDSVAEGDFYVASRIEELNTRTQSVTGTGTLRMFQSGRKFRLASHPRKDQVGEYLITSTEYHFIDPDLESGTGEGTNFQCHFTAIRSQQQFRPPRNTPRPVVQGVQTAFVTGPSGSEIHTDEFGRVRVQFHWDRVGKNDEHSSCWLRVASIAAGPRFGFVSIPRIGHEVVVSFLEGDPDRPLITGVVYNGLNKPPWDLPAQKNRSGFLTRSTIGGSTSDANELRFDDTKGSELLRIHAQHDYEMRTENDLIDWIGGKAQHSVVKDELHAVDGNRHRTVVGNEKIKVGGSSHRQTDGDSFTGVGGTRHVDVGGDTRSQIGGGLSIKVGLDEQHKAGMNYAVDAGIGMHLKAGMNVVIEAGMMLTLKAAGSFISIGPAGVAISGMPLVTINSGGASGSGSGASPMAPGTPQAPDKPGEPPKPEQPAIQPRKPSTYGPRAAALKAAATTGVPFCELDDR